MRSVLTTLAELAGIWCVVIGVTALVGGPVLEVGAISGGLGLVVLGVSESP